MIALKLIFVMSMISWRLDLFFRVPCSAERLHRPVLSRIFWFERISFSMIPNLLRLT